MANLAIRGHATRGREVIELLEMLGGVNCFNFIGDSCIGFYYIDNDDEFIKNRIYAHLDANTKLFNIEDFMSKFPYKVGDKVSVYEYESKVRIDDMKWDGFEIQYSVFTDETEWYSAAELNELNKCNKPYKKETMEEELINKEGMSLKIDISQMEKRKIIFSADSPEETELVLGDNFEIKVEDGKIYVVRKKPCYPSSFDECLKILGYNASHTIPMNHGHKGLLMMRLQKLLILRDAYWKIAGGWKPDVMYCDLYYIGYNGDIITAKMQGGHKVLAFPTEEMRDAFYENFKDLIEQCKELL